LQIENICDSTLINQVVENMPPQKQNEVGVEAKNDNTTVASSVSNDDLMEDAGKVHMDEAQMWGQGIINDFRRTVGTHWLSEIMNFNQKTIAVTLLMFISVIAPTLTFGAVYGKVTGNVIGTVETILATSWVGVTYSLIGGMPLVSKSPSSSCRL
jgi:VIT1/CCC1 family predicted Fe2+/Mn2+ transporter